jgi:membrane-associated phospholipid phosphatase
MKKIAFLFIFCITTGTVSAQTDNEGPEKIYDVNLAIDLPVAIVGSALAGYGFKKIDEKKSSSIERVNSLDFNNVSGFNRFFGGPRYSEWADNTSDLFFYGAFPVGLGLFLDKKIRSDWATIALMYWETMAITGAIYSNTAANVNKYRPLAYPGSGAPEDERTEDGAKNSFPGGHPTITAAATFFTAKVIQDYYPDRPGLHIVAYSFASAFTLTNVYLRHRAGKHFASDLGVGMAYSIPIGILVPQLHKIAKNNEKISLRNSIDGLTLSYTIE